jgi:hypothetical protein
MRYDGAYWARIDTMENSQLPARIDVHLNHDTCDVAIENVDRFHLDLVPQLVGSAKELKVRINGADPISVPTATTVYFHRADGKWAIASARYPQELVKKHGLSGPIQDVFMQHPVLLVYGTARPRDPAVVTKLLDDIVDRLISTGDGSGVLCSGFERKADTDVSDRDLAEKNLILVGTPQQNQLLARIADKLPATFLDDGVKIGGKELRGPGVGLMMVYPNPLNRERYILLVPEIYAGAKPLDYPDYVVLQSLQDGKGKILTKGAFNARWLDPE